MKRKEMESLLKINGFRFVRGNKHLIYSNDVFTIALPSRNCYTKGLTRRILQQSGFSKEQIKEII